MAIEVSCKCGRLLRVKEKHAGTSGRCPYCKTLLAIPASTSTPRSMLDVLDNYDDQELVHQQSNPHEQQSSGLSIFGASAIRAHHKRCPVCGTQTLYWHASCPKCKTLFSGDTEFTD